MKPGQSGPGGIGDHGSRAYNDANLSIPNTAFTVLTLNSERWDTDDFHSTSSNTSRLTVPTGQTGLYICGAAIEWAANAVGIRFLELFLNGDTRIAALTIPVTVGGASVPMTVSTVYSLAATNYLEARVYQSSGAALDVLASANFSPELWLQRIA